MNKIRPQIDSPSKGGQDQKVVSEEGRQDQPLPKVQAGKPRIKKWIYYLLWINSYTLSNFYFGLCIMILSFTYPSMKNSNNMNWSDEEGDRYISMMVSAGNLAIVVTGIFYPLLKNHSPKKIAVLTKIALLASVLGITYPNLITMIISRLVTGSCVSILLSVGNSNTYLVSHPKHRNRSMIIFSLYFSIAFGLASLVSSFDDGGQFMWRLIFYIQALIVALDILAEIAILTKTDGPFYIIKQNGPIKMVELFQTVFQEEDSKMVAMERIRSQEKEKESGMGLKQTIKLYNKEFVLTMLSGVSLSLTFYSIFYSYGTIWLTSDIDNESEVSVAKIFILLMSLVQTVAKIVNAVFNIVKNRKSALITAHILNLLSWVLVWITYATENLIFARIGSLLLSFAIDGILFPTYYAYMAEIAPPALISLGFTASELVALIANFVSPYFFGDASPRKNFVYGVPVLMVVQLANLLIVWIFFIESYGLEKSQIYKKLRGMEYKNTQPRGSVTENAAKLGQEGGGGVGTERKALVEDDERADENKRASNHPGTRVEGLDGDQKLEDIKNMVLGESSERS